MATDNLKELGKDLGKSKRQLQRVASRVGERFPIVERARDTVYSNQPFSAEFITTRANQTVKLDLDLYRAPLTDANVTAGPGIRIGPDGTINTGPDSGTWTDPNAINEQPAPTPTPISDGGVNPPPTADNSSILTADDFNYIYPAFPGNVYDVVESKMITMVGFYAEANPSFSIAMRKSVGPGGLILEGVNDAAYSVIENRFWTHNVFQGTYADTRPGWHVITHSGVVFNAGETAVFQFTNPTRDPTVYHYSTMENFTFMNYRGQNRYQFINGEIITDTLGVDPDGTHGIQPSYPGAPIPPYAMFVAYQGFPPRGFLQVEEAPSPVFRDLTSANLPIISVGIGDPRYLAGTLEFKTLFKFTPNTLRVWLNGLRQAVNYSYTVDDSEHYFTFSSDYPNIDLSWERILVSYEVEGA